MEKNKKIKKQTIAFDVDGTLIDMMSDTPNYQVVNLLLWFLHQVGWDVIVWSGGGVDYAKMYVRRLGFEEQVRVIRKFSEKVDIAIDDEINPEDADKTKTDVIIKV